MKVFHYKGFIGSAEADLTDKCLHGKLLYISDLVTYEGQTVEELENEFKVSVEEYLQTCERLGREPMKPFKGSLNVRIGAELHKEAAVYAAEHGVTLNECIREAVQSQVQYMSAATKEKSAKKLKSRTVRKIKKRSSRNA